MTANAPDPRDRAWFACTARAKDERSFAALRMTVGGDREAVNAAGVSEVHRHLPLRQVEARHDAGLLLHPRPRPEVAHLLHLFQRDPLAVVDDLRRPPARPAQP